jgi:hypothetical protein
MSGTDKDAENDSDEKSRVTEAFHEAERELSEKGPAQAIRDDMSELKDGIKQALSRDDEADAAEPAPQQEPAPRPDQVEESPPQKAEPAPPPSDSAESERFWAWMHAADATHKIDPSSGSLQGSGPPNVAAPDQPVAPNAPQQAVTPPDEAMPPEDEEEA